jgi:hypothetical protein
MEKSICQWPYLLLLVFLYWKSSKKKVRSPRKQPNKLLLHGCVSFSGAICPKACATWINGAPHWSLVLQMLVLDGCMGGVDTISVPNDHLCEDDLRPLLNVSRLPFDAGDPLLIKRLILRWSRVPSCSSVVFSLWVSVRCFSEVALVFSHWVSVPWCFPVGVHPSHAFQR